MSVGTTGAGEDRRGDPGASTIIREGATAGATAETGTRASRAAKLDRPTTPRLVTVSRVPWVAEAHVWRLGQGSKCCTGLQN